MTRRNPSRTQTFRYKVGVIFCLTSLLPLLLFLFVVERYNLVWQTQVMLVLGMSVVIAVLGFVYFQQTVKQISTLAEDCFRVGRGELEEVGGRHVPQEISEMARIVDTFNRILVELKANTQVLQSATEELEASNEDLKTTNEELEKKTKELQETQEKLIQQEKLAAVGQLASGVGHELRNPLGVIKNAAYYIKGKLPEDPKLQKHIGIMEKEIANSNKIISDLLGFSYTRPPAIVPSDINKVVEDILEVVEIPENVKLIKELGTDLPNAMADPDQTRQVFVNLSLNAIQAMPEGGQLKISTRKKDDFIEVEFTDTGCGIPEENLKKLYDPFFTTRVHGIGLGLAVTQGIIERHNGIIEVSSDVSKGTTFVVKLPVEKKGG